MIGRGRSGSTRPPSGTAGRSGRQLGGELAQLDRLLEALLGRESLVVVAKLADRDVPTPGWRRVEGNRADGERLAHRLEQPVQRGEARRDRIPLDPADCGLGRMCPSGQLALAQSVSEPNLA